MVAGAVAFLDEPCRNGDAQRGELAHPNWRAAPNARYSDKTVLFVGN